MVSGANPTPMPAQVTLLAGGSPHAHDFDRIARAVEDALDAEGIAVDLVRHPDRLPARLDLGTPLIVHGLWWRMLEPAYDRWRADHAYSTTEPVRRALQAFVADGGSLLAMHTAVVCFDDWEGWGRMLGGSWEWGLSLHPPPAEAEVVLVDHAISEGLGPTLCVVDEIFGDLHVSDAIEVVARARRDPADELQPIVWTHRYGSGRVVVDLLGHDERSLRNDDHRRLLHNALGWLMAERAAA